MTLSEMLLPEFDQEMATTRKTLERVPEDKPDWKPHEKSMTLARLAGHVAELPMWADVTLRQESLDMNPPGGEPMRAATMTSRRELLEQFDSHVTAARQALASAKDEDFGRPWTLLSGGKPLFTMPKLVVLRSFVLSHMVHHRAQLGVYLRMNDVPLPATYGHSADERGM